MASSPSRSFTGLGLVGFGNIGSGVVRWLQTNENLINSRLSRPLRLVRIADVDITTSRGVEVSRSLLTTDYFEVIADPAIQIVIELIGGVGIARKVVEGALRAGKHVVTANKALLAACGAELQALAAERGLMIGAEASVGAGIPVIRAMKQALAPNRFTRVAGILNGTTNFILSKMEATGAPFGEILAEAQRLGYAEPDPTFDIEGTDAAHKLAILASLAFGQDIRIEHVAAEGITRLRPAHFDWAARRGWRIKLVALASQDEKGAVDAHVAPTLVRREGALGAIMGVYNAVQFQATPVGQVQVSGRGAGQESTSSGVLSDVMMIAALSEQGADAAERMLEWPLGRRRVAPAEDSTGRFAIAVEPEEAARATPSKILQVFEKAKVGLAEWEGACDAESATTLWTVTTAVALGAVQKAVAQCLKTGLIRDSAQIFRMEPEL